MDKLEKTARALAVSDGFDPDMLIEGANRLPTDKKMWQHPLYLKYAKAAIDAGGNDEQTK